MDFCCQVCGRGRTKIEDLLGVSVVPVINQQPSASGLRQTAIHINTGNTGGWSSLTHLDWRSVCCVQRCREAKRHADMNGLCCCTPCKPRYRRLVDAIYPRAAGDGLQHANMSKLDFYAISHPEKLERIGEYLVQRIGRDLLRQRVQGVKVAVEAMDLLLQSCHSSPSLPQFSENHLKMVQRLLESGIPEMEQLATDSFVTFSNIEESTPCYHRQYDFFISKFSQMCHSEKQAVKVAGLRGLRGVVWKSVTDDLQANIWEQYHMEKIIPSILYNLHYDEDVDSPSPVVPVVSAQSELLDDRFTESARDREDTPKSLADQCLRELMGKATFGSLRAVLDPVLAHVDNHNKWQPPPMFAIQMFRTILYSIQTQNSYFVIQELINHLDQLASSDASVRIGIATVISNIVGIAGNSIGPLLLSIFNSLLKHLRTSVEFQLSPACKSKTDESTYQETLINAMGDFANALPDYQKVEMMMFTVGNIPSLTDTGRRRKEGEEFLQHVLVKTLLKVATKYRTAYLATVFTDSFLTTLLQLSLVQEREVRMMTQRIFHTLLDRHDNLASLTGLGYVRDVAELQLTVEKCSRADQMFMRKHVHDVVAMVWNCAVLVPEDEFMREHLDAIQCTMSLLCIEVGYDETLMELVRVSLSLEAAAADASNEKMGGERKRAAVLNMVARYLNLSSQLLAIPGLCQHITQVVSARAASGPKSLNILAEDSDGQTEAGKEGGEETGEEKDEEAVPAVAERVELSHLADHPEMLFDRNVIAEALKSSGKDVSRLSVPFSAARLSPVRRGGEMGADGVDGGGAGGGGEGGVGSGKEDAVSADLSFDWTPPASTHQSRRGTVFSLNNVTIGNGKLSTTGLPWNVSSLRALANQPVDHAEVEQRERELTESVLEQMRSRPFEELADEICAENEKADLTRTVHRLLARNADTVRMAEIGRKPAPKDAFEIDLPKFVY